MAEKKKTSDAVRILDETFVKGNSRERRAIDKEKKYIQIAEQIHALRTKANLTQKELAERVGTTQSAICRLENADYGRHSLKMLDKIAKAMHCRIEVRLIPDEAYWATT